MGACDRTFIADARDPNKDAIYKVNDALVQRNRPNRNGVAITRIFLKDNHMHVALEHDGFDGLVLATEFT
jgi:hypothetical protein